MTIAILLTVVFAFLGAATTGLLAWACIRQRIAKPIFPYLGLAGLLFAWIGMDVASRVMTLLPSRCPKCSGKARYHFVAWRWKNGFIPTRQYGYACAHCGWTKEP